MKTRLYTILALGWAATAWGADYTAPCTVDMPDADAFAKWTAVDANNDGTPYRWEFTADGPGALYTQNKSGAANDWIISPAVAMKGGVSYKITATLQSKSTYGSDRQKFKIMAGTAPDVASMTSELCKNENFSVTTWAVTESGNFSPETDGDYYFAIYCYSASFQGDFYFEKFEITEEVPYPAAATGLTVTPAPEGALRADLAWTMPAKNNLGGALAEVSGVKVYRGTSNSFTIGESSLIATVAGGKPGEATSWSDATLTEPGEYYYAVSPYNANGDCPTTPTRVKSSGWIGMDTSLASLTGVTASVVEGNDKAVALTFDAPKGSHGAPVDMSKVAYQISRKAEVADVTVTLEEAWAGELPYVDATIESLDSYVYTVKTVYNGSTSWNGVSAPAVVTGGTVAVPYTNNFGSAASAKLLTIFHGSECTRDWALQSSYGRMDFWGGSKADAWFVLPAFNLEAGKAYELEFDTWVSNASSPKDLYVYIGRQATAEALEPGQLFVKTVDKGTAETPVVKVSVETSGVYYIGFRCYGQTNSNDIYVDNIKFDEVEIVPEAVTSLTAEAGAEGALSVALGWVNPSKTNAGGALTEITKVEVMRGAEVVATIAEGLVPGEAASYTDAAVPAAGVYTYSVVPYMGEKAGPKADVTTAWVGPDTPKAPTGVVAAIDGSVRKITFEAPAEGVNGGYLNTAIMTFTILRNGEEIDWGVKGTEYTDTDADLPLARYTYGVKAVTGDLESEVASAPAITVGDALALPYTPDFSDASHFELWTLTGTGTKTFSHNAKESRLESSTSDSWAFTPPIQMSRGTVQLTHRLTCYNWRYTEDFEFYLSKSDDIAAADHHTLVGTAHVEDVSYGSDKTIDIPVPENGVYRVAVRLPTANWTGKVHKLDLVQTINTGIDEIGADTSAYDAATGCLDVADGSTVEVYDVAGRRVMSVADTAGPVSVVSLMKGVYMAVAVAPDGTKSIYKFAK